MNSDELKRLRMFYRSLSGYQKIYESSSEKFISGISIVPLEDELRQLNEEFPSLIQQPFNKHQYFDHSTLSGATLYRLTAIKTYINGVLARLEIEINEAVSIPVTEKLEFTFISDSALRAIIERDYSEIRRAYTSGCWKSVIILCGGAIEAILTDLLSTHETIARAATEAPRKSDITRWDLSALINVAVELKLVSAGVEKLSHSLREYRNLVHPGNELRNELRFDAEEAKIAFEVLNIVHRDLSN